MLASQNQNLLEELTRLLETDPLLVSEGKLLKNKIIELTLAMDASLIKKLIGHESIKKHFFADADGVLVFDKIKFQQFVSNKSFLPDSYTAFKNKIGLTAEGSYLTDSKEVVLAWPYKDCVLEGGQTKDDDARDEVFWNETLAPDQIDRLLAPKVLTNFKKFDKDGQHQISAINADDNLIIKGNNLLALHTLKSKYAGRVKLIYIDPPYNTGSDSFKYNDSFNHSTWLSFVSNRLKVAKKFLTRDGVIFIQCDDNEQAYLKVLLDEVFGRENFINTVSVNMKNVAGASGGGEDKKLKKNIEYIHVYANDYFQLKPFKGVYDYMPMSEVVEQYREEGKSWKYTSILFYEGDKKYIGSTVDGDGNKIEIFLRLNPVYKSINQVIKEEGLSEKDAYEKYASRIFEPKDAQSSIRTRIIEARNNLSIDEDLISIEYVPKTGRNKGVLYEQFYKGNSCRLFAWLKDIGEIIDGVLFKKSRLGTYWDVTSSINNLTKEGDVELLSGKKPESLIQKIIEMSTNNGDIVMDYHLGSGTTAAVAHKMNRRYIGIEQLDYAENDSIVRLKNVVNGDESGISKDVDWQGGGSFIYCELAKANQTFIDQIQDAENSQKLIEIWQLMQEKAFLSYRVDPKKIDLTSADFTALSLDDQKRFLVEVMDKNMLYVPVSEIDDVTYGVSEADKTLNRQFFSKS